MKERKIQNFLLFPVLALHHYLPLLWFTIRRYTSASNCNNKKLVFISHKTGSLLMKRDHIKRKSSGGQTTDPSEPQRKA